MSNQPTDTHDPYLENDTDLFADLPDEEDPISWWKFNQWQATVLGGMTLWILLTVIGSGMQGRWVFTSVILGVISLPSLIIYIMLEKNRVILRSGELTVLFGIGQTSSVFCLAAFIASYSLAAVVALVAVFIGVLCWVSFIIPKRLGIKWSKTMIYPEPQYHRKKLDRLLWSICATFHELKLKPEDLQVDGKMGPADFDGVKLNKVSFTSPEIERRFQDTFLKMLRYAAQQTKNARRRDE